VSVGPIRSCEAPYRLSAGRIAGSSARRRRIRRQWKDCSEHAARHNWPTITITDNDVSASRYSRRKVRIGYRDMLAAMEAGRTRRMVAWSLDRLYRQPKELEVFVDLADPEIGNRAIEAVMLPGDVDLRTPHGRFIARTLVNQAAMESDPTSWRMKRQKRERRSEGKRIGRTDAFGWLLVREDEPDEKGHYKVIEDGVRHDEYEAGLIREAADAVPAGATVAEIARKWNDQGVPTRRRGRWYSATVKQILTSPRNAGMVSHRGEAVRPATWPAVIEPEKWERLVAVIEGRGNRISPPRRSSLLTGLVICQCGAVMRRDSHRGKPVYRCMNRVGYTSCGPNNVPAEPVEAAATEAILEAWTSPSWPTAPPIPGRTRVSLAAQLAEVGGPEAPGAKVRQDAPAGVQSRPKPPRPRGISHRCPAAGRSSPRCWTWAT
jgi:site-specific DNA recombinase